eukprot:3161644-Pyramimonas_sp.AAC.1
MRELNVMLDKYLLSAIADADLRIIFLETVKHMIPCAASAAAGAAGARPYSTRPVPWSLRENPSEKMKLFLTEMGESITLRKIANAKAKPAPKKKSKGQQAQVIPAQQQEQIQLTATVTIEKGGTVTRPKYWLDDLVQCISAVFEHPE